VFSPEADRDIGFDPRNTFTAQIRLPEARGLSSRERHLLYEGVRDRISMLPGVLDTSVASVGGWVGLGTSDLVHALTGNPAAPGSVKPARYHAVSPGFFRMLRVPVLHGREFGPTDTVGAPRVVVVNKAFVNRFYLVDNGIRRNVQLHGISVDGPWYTIVGVVEDIRAEGLGSGTEPVPKVYLSALQHPPSSVGLAVRTTGDPMRLFPAVEEAVHFLAPEAKLSGAVTMEQYLARFRAPLRWFAVLLGVLAGVALLLATSGLHSVMSYNVTRRTREIGIRMAVGARAKDITRMVLGQSLRITIMGVMLGLFGALPLARLLQLLLRGVEPFDPLLFGGISVLLGSVSLLASYRPAQRAASVEPQISLQAE
jgi:predicted permease